MKGHMTSTSGNFFQSVSTIIENGISQRIAYGAAQGVNASISNTTGKKMIGHNKSQAPQIRNMLITGNQSRTEGGTPGGNSNTYSHTYQPSTPSNDFG